jgi:phage terminase small subunit
MLTEKQKEFCKLFISGKNATDSYSIAFTTAKQGTSKAASSRLLKTDKIKSYISELQLENKKIIAMANEKASQQIANGSIADAAERMQMLTKILRGELSIEEEVTTPSGIVTLIVKPSFGERRAAIAELNKMGGDYAPAKTETTITDTRPPTTVTMPDGTKIEI